MKKLFFLISMLSIATHIFPSEPQKKSPNENNVVYNIYNTCHVGLDSSPFPFQKEIQKEALAASYHVANTLGTLFEEFFYSFSLPELQLAEPVRVINVLLSIDSQRLKNSESCLCSVDYLNNKKIKKSIQNKLNEASIITIQAIKQIKEPSEKTTGKIQVLSHLELFVKKVTPKEYKKRAQNILAQQKILKGKQATESVAILYDILSAKTSKQNVLAKK